MSGIALRKYELAAARSGQPLLPRARPSRSFAQFASSPPRACSWRCQQMKRATRCLLKTLGEDDRTPGERSSIRSGCLCDTHADHTFGANLPLEIAWERPHWLAGPGGFELSDPEKPPLEHDLTATERRSARHIPCTEWTGLGCKLLFGSSAGKVSDRQTFRNEGKFGPHFKGQFWKRHL